MTTYYLRADGTAANKGAATGPGSSQSACMNVAVHNAETFSPGDTILICDEGGIYRETIIVPSGGSSANAILYGPESGDSPRMYGSKLAVSWVDQTGNQWRSDIGAISPDQVWFSKSASVHHGNKETILGNVNAEYDWYYDGSQYLWCYSTSDPDSAYDWVEAGQRLICFRIDDKDFVKVQGNLEFAFANSIGIFINGTTATIVDGILAHHNGYFDAELSHSIIGQNTTNFVVQNCTINNSGTHSIYVQTSGGNPTTGTIIQYNTCYDSYHSEIDFQAIDGPLTNTIIRYNHCYKSSDYDVSVGGNMIYCNLAAMSGVAIYYNVMHDLVGTGINIANGVVNAELYNNLIYGTAPGASGSSGILQDTADAVNIIIKNNIASELGSCLLITNVGVIGSCDNNLWFNSIGSYVDIGASSYGVGDFAASKAATGFDTNGKWEDPKLIDAVNGDFRLQSDSPCIDTGVDVGLTVDFDGIPLGRGTNPDIGAFETLKGGPRNI